MELDRRWQSISSGDAAVDAYRVRPAAAGEPVPAVIVIQEAWGPDEHIQDVAGRLANAGYLALAPDLYSRGRRPPELEPERVAAVKRFLDSLGTAAWGDPARREEALAAMPGEAAAELRETLAHVMGPQRPMAQYVADLRAAVSHLRADVDCDGRVASIGFCLGGSLSALLASADPRLDGAIVFYGGAPEEEQVRTISCPVLGLYGSEDARITPGVPGLVTAMEQAGKEFEHHVYEGAPHAFFNDTRPSYRVAAARDAWARALMFLARNLMAG